MNIKDVENFVSKGSPLKEIFERQMILAKKYTDIEKMGNLLETTNINIDTKEGQLWIKEFAWRITEELTEAIQPLEENESLTDDHILHYFEELADALHFFVEMAIISGYSSEDFYELFDNGIEIYGIDMIEKDEIGPRKLEGIRLNHWKVVYELGLMCNTLKNKRWKQTQLLTDHEQFSQYIKRAFEKLILCFIRAGCDIENIYNFYFKKSEVNRFRQRTNY